jgi:hypothetical protein
VVFSNSLARPSKLIRGGAMFIRLSILFLVFLLFTPTAQATDIDWAKARTEAVQLLQELIRIDTTNPPGNERAVCR